MTLLCSPLNMLIERVMVTFLLEMEPPLPINLVCSTAMFRINIKTASAPTALVSLTNNSGRYNKYVTLVKRNTDMTSLNCAGLSSIKEHVA